MSCANTAISWSDKTHNYFRGCSIKDKGCQQCYAMSLAGSARLARPGKAYAGLTRQTSRGPVWTGEVRAIEGVLDDPIHWRKPSMIFSNSMSDWQHGSIAWDAKQRLLQTYRNAPRHVYQLLTKRVEEQRMFFTTRTALGFASLPPSFWVGVSVTHPEVLYRIELLRQTPGIQMRWVSFEPLIADLGAELDLRGLDWVVVGGESEHDRRSPARPMHTAWAARIISLAKTQRVPVFFKQWGRWVSTIHLKGRQAELMRPAGHWLNVRGEWLDVAPKRGTPAAEVPIWRGGPDLLVKHRNQKINLWYGQPLEQWPTGGFFPSDWPGAPLLSLRPRV